jgi:hypothetical protein
MPRFKEQTRNEPPPEHIRTYPIAPLVGGEEIVIALECDYHRISCGPVSSLFGKIRYGCESIIKVDRIAVCLLLTVHVSPGRIRDQEKEQEISIH